MNKNNLKCLLIPYKIIKYFIIFIYKLNLIILNGLYYDK